MAQKDDDDNKDFEDLICHEENDHIEDDQNDLHKYFSNGEGAHAADDNDSDEFNNQSPEKPQALSMQDLEESKKESSASENS